MITAADARKRAQMSNDAVDQFVEALGVKIEEAANKGLYEIKYHGNGQYDPTKDNEICMESFMTFKVPQFWELVIAKLKSHPLNYMAKIGHSESYFPRGLANDDGEGPEYIDYYIVISW
jgi:hypothetical protein